MFGNKDYPEEYFDKLYSLEGENFWFRSRNRIVKNLFKKYIGPTKPAKILEIGCGTGYVLKGLSEFSSYKLCAAELYLNGLKFAKKRLPNVEFLQLDARELPFEDKFDAVGTFDMLEHIDEDILVMQNINKSLKKGGLFFISVPQHTWLWSTQDDTAFHKRRYSRKEMRKKLQTTGFKIRYISSFVFILLPFMLLSRLRMKKKVNENNLYSFDELTLPPLLNSILEFFMRIDELLIKRGGSLPVGGSLIVVAVKKENINL